MPHSQQKGSKIAKDGFANEEDVIQKFLNWKTDKIAQEWLTRMGYTVNTIKKVEAIKISAGYKTDIQVQVTVFLKNTIDAQNIQIKLVSTSNGFNQIDRRRVQKCEEQWNLPPDIANLLRYFTGEVSPRGENSHNNKRMFLSEFTVHEQEKIVKWFTKNKILVLTDIMKGRGRFAAEWMLVVQKDAHGARRILQSMNTCLNIFGDGEVYITPKGSLKIGNITLQRKGGDGGRASANQLQFKINPALLFEKKVLL